MRPRPPLPPLWFLALCAGAVLVVRLALGQDADAAPPVALGWFGFLVTIAHAIWTGVQVAGRITLAILQYSVMQLWNFARTVYNGALELGKLVGVGFTKSWEFFHSVYDQVLKPAWVKFWTLVDRVRDTLDRVFRPVFEVLRRIREEFLKYYDRFVRPVLDTIGVARKVLRVFSALGLDWARTLDRKLGELEEKIDAPFRYVLRQINGVINLLNRVVTANGLFQRLALVRSIERDIRYVRNAWHHALSRPLTDDDRAAAVASVGFKSGAQLIAESRTYLETDDGPRASSIREWVTELELRLRGG